MKTELRFVLDTNVLVSAALRPASTPRRAFDLALAKGSVLISEATVSELNDVLSRPKFARYISEARRLDFLAAYIREAHVITATESIDACRDAKDNQFLEVAVCGQATAIVTGDNDLLTLNPFRGIHVLTPEQFLTGSWIDSSDKEESFQVSYPFFVVGTKTEEAVTFPVGDRECLAAYHSKEMAELFIEQSADPTFHPLTISNPEEAKQLAEATIRQGIDSIVWHSTLKPAWFKFSRLSDLLT